MNSDACNNAETPSDGYHVLDVTSQLTCDLSGSYLPPATSVCTTWKTQANPTLQLSLYVKGDCSIVVSPITEDACADPLKADYTGPYTYGQIQMRAYYQTLTSIRSLLPAPGAGSDYSRWALLAGGLDLLPALAFNGCCTPLIERVPTPRFPSHVPAPSPAHPVMQLLHDGH